MEMHQIRYFLAVADELNFTRAAAKCNVSQPSLTRAVRLLAMTATTAKKNNATTFSGSAIVNV